MRTGIALVSSCLSRQFHLVLVTVAFLQSKRNNFASWAGQKWQRKTSAVLSRVGTIKRCAFVQQPPHPASCRLPWALHCTKRPQPGTLKISEDVRRDWSYTMIYRSKESEWEKCWISMALYSQCLQLAGTWTGRLWNQIRQGHWRRGLFIPNAWSCLCKHKGQIPNRRIMRKREVLQKHHRDYTVVQLFQRKEHQIDMFHGFQICHSIRFHWFEYDSISKICVKYMERSKFEDL